MPLAGGDCIYELIWVWGFEFLDLLRLRQLISIVTTQQTDLSDFISYLLRD